MEILPCRPRWVVRLKTKRPLTAREVLTGLLKWIGPSTAAVTAMVALGALESAHGNGERSLPAGSDRCDRGSDFASIGRPAPWWAPASDRGSFPKGGPYFDPGWA